MRVLHAGKVPPKILKDHVFPFLGASDPDILLEPGIGRDAAVLQIGRRILVATTDPITGAIQNMGAYAVHICANDIATFGVLPRWFLVTILLPEGTDTNILRDITTSMHNAAKSLNVAIIGGHTEVTPGIPRPIICGFMLGTASKGRYVTSTSAKPNNALILSKGVGIEGTSILAWDRGKDLRRHLDDELIQQAQRFIEKLSVVPEAIQAMELRAVTAMHDPTEGGVANGLHELADASKLGFIVNRGAIVIHEETRQICDILQIDPLNLIASGAMLMAVKPSKAHKVLAALEQIDVDASIIGTLVENPKTRLITEQ
ncbi:MAG: AIR synthase family protein, partial [Promethearchaeota archaeon]